MSFIKLVKVLDYKVKQDAIYIALLYKGFYYYLAIYKPLIIEKN